VAKAKGAAICINMASTLNHLELVHYDPAKGTFVAVDTEPCMFDPTTRESLEAGDVFEHAIKRLFDRNRIGLKSPTVMVVPSFFTRHYEMVDTADMGDMKSLLMAEAERFYVFKKIDAEIGYAFSKGNTILYTAYPLLPIQQIRDAFADLKIPLLSIDCNYTATLRGLVAMGIVQNEVDNQLKWGLLVLSNFNLFMAVVDGNDIEKVGETPLSLQNMDVETLLGEVRDDFQQFFGYEILSRLVVVNNSQKLYSSEFVSQLGFQGPVDVFDQNERTLASYGSPDSPFPCSLEAVGGALAPVLSQVPTLELADVDSARAMESQSASDRVGYALIGLGILLLIAVYGIGTALDSMKAGESVKGASLQQEIQTSLNSLSIVPEVKRKLFVKQTMLENYTLNNILIKLSQTLPPDAWLDTLTLTALPEKKQLNMTVKGGALSSDPLNAYVKELNVELKDLPLKPGVIPKTQDGQRYFEFTLANDPTATVGGPQQ